MIRFSFLFIFQLLTTVAVVAQTYSPVTITGFNSDLIAETAPNSLSTTSMSTDLTAHVMYSQGFAAAAGLPAGIVNSGTIVSGTRTYQMASFSSQNALYVDVGLTQSITLFTTSSYSKISLMGFSAEGNSTLNIKLTFTDGTTTNYGNFTLSDWFNGLNAVYCCFSRCVRTATGPYNVDGLPSNPRFYPIDISLSCDDQHKNLQTITIKNLNGTTAFTNAFLLALSGVPFSQNIFSFVNNETCPGANNGSINLFTGGTSAPYTYSWNTTPVQTTANATNLDSGIYVCKITDINGCITYDTVSVLLMPVIPLNTLANPPVICEGASTQLTVAGLSAFSWSPGGQTTSPAIVSPVVTTDYIVSGNDANGCTRQDTVTVTVNPLPVIIVNPNPASICTGGNIVLQASGASAYSWSPSTGLSNTTIFNPVANPADTTVYTVTGIDANGCSNSATVEVAVKPSPLVVAAANPSTICQGASSDLSVSGLNSFTWYPGGQTISPIIVSPLVTTIYTVTGSGSNGCNGQGTVTVTVNTLPTINCAPASTAICKSDSVLLTANGGVSYSWSPATDLNDPAVSNPFASPTTTTIYTVTGFDANGCSSTATSVVTVYNAPSVIAVADPSSICEGSSTQLSVSGLSLFNWNPGGQTISPITVSPNGSTTYTISGTDVNGCSGEGTVTVTVAPNPVVAVTSTDTIICNGTQATLIASGTATQYIWTPGAITGSMVSVSPSDTTEYILTGVLGNCTAIDSITINVVPSPDVAFFPSLLEGCDPLLVSFTDQSLNGTEWSWLFGDGGSAAVQNPEHIFHPGTWSITETVSNEAGCTSTLVLPELIQVYADPVADFTVNPGFYEPVELINAEFQFLNQSIGATDFFWDFADEVFSDEEDPLHRYIAPGDYAVTLIATGPGNCSDTISKSFLTVIPSTIGFIPTAFTPNGDGLNDLFLPTNTNLVGMDMKIFNRWGNLIFHGTSPADGWNGTYQDLPAEIGVYVYSISLQFENGKQEVRKGNLTLVR